MKTNKSFALWAGIFLLGAILLIVGVSNNKSGPESVPAEVVKSISAVAPDDHTVGNPQAPVVLIEYLDFECEACGAFFPVVKKLEETYPDDLLVIKRYFPLPSHKNSMTAALAVEAASRQGKYNEMHDLLFTEQQSWGEKAVATPQVFEAFAEQLGLNMDQFRKDVALTEVKDRVQRDLDDAIKIGAQGTPTFVLNGRRIQNPPGFEAFQTLIDAELSKSPDVAAPLPVN